MAGMFADIFHALQEKMNFTYDLVKPPDFEWGVEKDDQLGLWTGMVGQLQHRDVDIGNKSNCHKLKVIFAIAVTDFTVTKERSQVMTFAEPITQIYNSLFIKNPANVPNYTAYTQSFHWNVWFANLAVLVVGAIILYIAIR